MSGEGKSFEKCSVVLLDVLGTTTSIDFAKDTLFPFVTKNVEEVLKAKWEEEDVKAAVKQLKEGDEDLDLEASVKLVKELTEVSSENAGLKTIQGLVYAKGYESGDLKAHVFEDVKASLESWTKSHKVAVYSTGSTESQKLLFSHSISGDLTSHISKFFDQAVGAKTEADSYKKIAEELKVKPEEILFVTDLIEEAKAAKAAGLSTVLISREGNAKLPEESKEFVVVSSFKEIVFENPSKRKNVDEPAVTEEPPSKVAKTEDADKKVEEEPKVEEAMEVDAPAAEPKLEDKSEESKAEEKTEEAPKVEETNEEKTEESVKVDSQKESDSKKKDVTETKTEESNKADQEEDKKEVVESEQKPEEVTTSPSEETKEEKQMDKEGEKVVEEAAKTEVESTTTKVTEEVAKVEEETAVENKLDEEKENKKDLANGLENGDKDSEECKKAAATNGETNNKVEEVNGDDTKKVAEEAATNGKEEPTTTSATEEIKVKKVEATESSAEAPAVSVEV